MKLKKLAAVGLSAAMIFTTGMTAMAADVPQVAEGVTGGADSIVATPDAGHVYHVSAKAKIKELGLKDEKGGDAQHAYILIETVEATPQAIQLNISEETVIMDTQTGLPVSRNDLKKDQEIFAYYDAAMTRSLPPQAHAQAILVNLSETHAPAHLLTVEKATDMDGTVNLVADNGTIIVKVAADTPISALYTKNIVRNTDLHMGSRIFAWYDIVALSMPGQANALKVVVLPNDDRDVTIVNEDGVAIGTGKVEDGVVMVPLRLTAEKLGFTVTWDAKNEAVNLSNGQVQTSVKLGNDSYYMASAQAIGMSKPSSLGAASYEIDGVSWAPAELFNILLSDGDTQLFGDSLHL